MQHLVTMFDRNHLVRGIACLKSYFKHGGESAFVLCVEEGYEDKLPAGVVPLKLTDLERRWPTIAATKVNRDLRGYIYSLKPFLAEMVLDLIGKDDEVLYVDCDVFFFGNPLSIKADAAIAAVRYPVAIAVSSYVRFNGGVILYKTACRTQPSELMWTLLEAWQYAVIKDCGPTQYDEYSLSFVADNILTPGVNIGRNLKRNTPDNEIICYHFSVLQEKPHRISPPWKMRFPPALYAIYNTALEEARHGLD